ncbi:hypothetical protein [Lactovum odontotermitis]
MNLNEILTDDQIDYLKDNTDGIEIKNYYSLAELNNLIEYLKMRYDEYTDESFEDDNDDDQSLEEILDILTNESGNVFDEDGEL